MICKRGGFIIQRQNELRDLEAELLNMVCYDVELEPGLQPVTGEDPVQIRTLTQAWIYMLEDSWRDKGLHILILGWASPIQIPTRSYFKPAVQTTRTREKGNGRVKGHRGLVFSTTGEMGEECIRCHCRLAELLAIKKGDVQHHYFMVSDQGFVCITEGGTSMVPGLIEDPQQTFVGLILKLKKGWPIGLSRFCSANF